MFKINIKQLEIKIFNGNVNRHSLADQIITYAIMIAVFVILTGIAFGLKKKRYSRDKIVGGYQGR
jgi:hypothetical protein